MSRATPGSVRSVDAGLSKRYGRPRPGRRRPLLDVLIETVLSQNTSDVNSHRAFLRLRGRYRGWADVMKAPVRSVAATVKSGGLANVKAVRIKALLDESSRRTGRPSLEHLREAPPEEAYQYLLSLKGVGPKTAACTLLFGAGIPVFPVDTHIIRISKRLGWARPTDDPARFQERFRHIVPDPLVRSLHINLIRHGRVVCHPRNPSCPACCIRHYCQWHNRRNDQ